MNCAFLLSSCDSYEDAWDPFFRLLGKYWPDLAMPVYLNTETKQFSPSVPLPFTVRACNNPGRLYWGERMLRVLRAIPEDYVFLVLDDLFLKSQVDDKTFAILLEKMEKEQDVASIQLNASRALQEGKTTFPVGSAVSLSEVPREGWKTVFNPTIWRKSVLIKRLRRHESIWGFELYGSQRARIWNYRERVLSLDSPLVYDYLWVKRCSVIVNGKWLDETEVDRFFAENGIAVDYSSRGRITVAQYRSKTMKDVLKKYTPLQIVQRCFYRVCSFF